MLGICQLRICRPSPLSFDTIFMDDVQHAGTDEKSIF